MITTRKDGFYQVENEAHIPCVGIETDNLPSCIEGIKQQNHRGIFCSPYHRFHSSNLNFLTAIPHIEAIVLRDTALDDINAIYSLENLHYFRCNPKRPAMDFSRLPSLKAASIEPVSRDTGLAALKNLQTLHLRNYRPRTRDFTLMPIPQTITELQLHWMNLTTLESLPDLPNLKRLEVIHCKNLTDLALDRSRFPQLEHFVSKACINVPEAEVERVKAAFSDLPSLSIEEEEEH